VLSFVHNFLSHQVSFNILSSYKPHLVNLYRLLKLVWLKIVLNILLSSIFLLLFRTDRLPPIYFLLESPNSFWDFQIPKRVFKWNCKHYYTVSTKLDIIL